MAIRSSTLDDFPAIQAIFEGCRAHMEKEGNHFQWLDLERVYRKEKEDIALGNSFVIDENGRIEAVFTLALGIDPTYIKIKGKWLNEEPYVTIHRIGSAFRIKGVMETAVKFALTKAKNVRIDTSSENVSMKGTLKKLGFVYVGIIWIDDGSERDAYQLCLD